ncbi:hypothetical protein LMG28688_03991 [Paraburkholderia caffeinitolerans]|uniref:Large ribosomal RNA subunit accumulation protein YceD n=1 Tax=Paraburkholderia caffeinitolerans TaxID=1723730 RepID=A0A6J5GCI9_9BURK|nr:MULTISPECIES: DUF177 domain-containing protein [Paraburkholderia]CAB3794846.1 hypothetical protein LMG28688_03991 [Paraburkholderia caffeinitolerans]
MTEHSGKPAGAASDVGADKGALNPRDFDIFEFARSGRGASGTVRLSQLPRMLNEVPADAPDRDTAFTWQAEGFTQQELQDNGTEGPQPYLRLAVHGAAWLTCQRCLAPYEQAFNADPVFRIVQTEDEADEFSLDDDEFDVIVGSRHFDLVDLIEEELLLSLPLVPKHDVCPEIHESLASGADGADGVDSVEDVPEQEVEPEERVNPFAALESLKKDGPGSKH